MAGAENQSTLLPDDMFVNTPIDTPWCFDLELFYQSNEDDEQSRLVLAQLATYANFSYLVNGVITSTLAIGGLFGNAMFAYQIRRSRYFSRRLACHLSMLCFWDSALLISCLLTYGIVSFKHGIVPIVGNYAYLLYFLQPVASLCVQATIWQVTAITVERYLAVARPLEQRTRNAQFSVHAICAVIAIGAFCLNMVPVPLERKLTTCYEFTQDGLAMNTMITQEEYVNNQYYAILVHLLPDIIFRAPIPIILISILTIRTLMICSRRTVGTTHIITARRNIPYLLTLLNAKFILCNSFYLINTILMEVAGYGGKTSSQQTDLEMVQYIRSLYLTDCSNMLLALHSATNWLIFYHWPRWNRNSKYLSLHVSTSEAGPKLSPIDRQIAEVVLSRFSARKYSISVDILSALCTESPLISSALLGSSTATLKSQRAPPTPSDVQTTPLLQKSATIVGMTSIVDTRAQQQSDNEQLQKHAVVLASVVEEILFALTSKGVSINEWRELCKHIGYRYHEVNLYCDADAWKRVRDVLVTSLGQYGGSSWSDTKSPAPSTSNLQAVLVKIFSYALCEMKSGALCAVVDGTKRLLVTKFYARFLQQPIRASKSVESGCDDKNSRDSPSSLCPVTTYSIQRTGAKISAVWPRCAGRGTAARSPISHSSLDFSTLEPSQTNDSNGRQTIWSKIRRLHSLSDTRIIKQ